MVVQLTLLMILFLLVNFADWFLELLNYRYLKKHDSDIPEEFEDWIDLDKLKETMNYTTEKFRFNLVSSVFDELLIPVFIFSGLLNLYNSWVSGFNFSFILGGLIFFLILSYLKAVIDIPFNLFSTFKIENKYGFNTMSLKLWIKDFLISLILSSILMGIIIGVSLLLIEKLPEFWWLPVWGFFFLFSIFMLYISPYVLEPLFNKFTPIEDEELEESIKSLLAKAGIKVSRVFKMDASRRTRHTNAYFSGIGPVKRIVLFDTLLDQLNGDEILAVLAHEAGHWKKKHIIKYLMIFEFLALTGAFLCFLLLQSDYLSRLFFISQDNFYVRLFLLGFVASIVLWPLQPLLNALSRHFERQADDFSVDLTGSASALSSALIKLSKDNLSNIHTHPLYAMFNYSHPEVIQRLRRLKSGATTVIQE